MNAPEIATAQLAWFEERMPIWWKLWQESGYKDRLSWDLYRTGLRVRDAWLGAYPHLFPAKGRMA